MLFLQSEFFSMNLLTKVSAGLLILSGLFYTSCIDNEIKSEIDFKDPVISLQEDSTITVVIQSNGLLSSKDTIYLVVSGGDAIFNSDLTTNIPYKGDTLKVFGSGQGETSFEVHANTDFEVEELEFIEFEIVKFTKGFREGLHRTVRLEIVDKEFTTVHFTEPNTAVKEGEEVEIILSSSMPLTEFDTVYLRVLENEIDITTDVINLTEEFYLTGNNSSSLSFIINATNDCELENEESFSVEIISLSKELFATANENEIITILDFEFDNHCLLFDGIDDYIDLGDIYDDLELPVTIEAWVNVDPVVDYAFPIFFSQDNLPLYNGVSFAVRPISVSVGYGDGRGENNSAFRRDKSASFENISNTWTHVAGVIRGATDMDLFVNGVNVGGSYSGSSNYPMSSLSAGDVAKIGFWLSNGITTHFKGKMDEVRVWNRSLTKTEINSNMCKRLSGSETGLIGYWNFDEVSGTTVNDGSPNGFNGVLKGGTTRVRSSIFVCNEKCQ